MDSLLSFSRLSREIRRTIHCGGRVANESGDVVPFLVVEPSQEWPKVAGKSVMVLTGRDRLSRLKIATILFRQRHTPNTCVYYSILNDYIYLMIQRVSVLNTQLLMLLQNLEPSTSHPHGSLAHKSLNYMIIPTLF